MDDATLIAELQGRRAARLLTEHGRFAPPTNPIASDLHPCVRYLALRQITPDARPPLPPAALETMEEGVRKEAEVLDQLRREGWAIEQQQAPFEERRGATLVVRGKIDGILRVDREAIPFEVKDTSPWVFAKLETEQDLEEMSVWTRKWRRQIQVYLYGFALQRGMVILTSRGSRKPIPIHLDYDLVDGILRDCERVQELYREWHELAYSAGVQPADLWLTAKGVPYYDDRKVCRSCPFFERSCFPPDTTPSGEMLVADDELRLKIERLHELKRLMREEEQLHREVKEISAKFPTILAGGLVVEGGWRERKMRAKPAQEALVQRFWGYDISGREEPE